MSNLNVNDKYKVWKKTMGKCAYCGTLLIMPEATGASDYVSLQFSIDHVIPTVRGGTNYMENLLPACRGCNSSKCNKTLEEYREMLEWSGIEMFTENQMAWLIYNGIELPKPPAVVFYFETIELG